MGYYSNVVIRLTTEDSDKQKLLLSDLEGRLKNVYSYLHADNEADGDDEFYIKNLFVINDALNGKEVTLVNDSVKWYEDFPEVKAVYDWLYSFDNDTDCAAQFIRVGEDVDDIEERTWGQPDVIDNWMYTRTTIEY